jgi:hypothetical protein
MEKKMNTEYKPCFLDKAFSALPAIFLPKNCNSFSDCLHGNWESCKWGRQSPYYKDFLKDQEKRKREMSK